MIETTLRTSFVPGTNVRGDIAGANWTFLLPSMEIDHAICLGAPSAEALATLARIAKRVTIVAKGTGRRAVRDWLHANRVRHVAVVGPRELAGQPPADLLWVIERDGLAIDGLVAPGGSVYEEGRSPARAGLALLLTPLGSEARTAVPLADTETIRWFARNGLHRPTLDLHQLKRLIGVRQRPNAVEIPDVTDSDGGAVEPAAAAGRSSFARRLARTLLAVAGGAETSIHRGPRLRALFGRRATLSCAESADAGPPRWLRELARSRGVDIAGCRWGLAAHGQYSSRKVLFYLWDHDAGDAAPRWVVKLTRNPQLNGRIENLVRALDALHRIPGVDARAVPEAAFHGEHAGLAVVAETAMEGAPFAARSRWNVECPAAANAIAWLVDLAAGTVTRVAAVKAASALRDLFDQFTGVYELRDDERAFLQERIDAAAIAAPVFPLVFQHGDPGTWNLLANDAGQVVFLDWEAAEPTGIPLWDLFYFARSFAVGCGRKRGLADSLAAIDGEMLSDAPVGRMLANAVHRYCERTGLHPAFVEPLFHTCWMHRALKESTRLTRHRLAKGHYLAMLRLGISRRDTPAMRRLFAG
jgi:hypothetical protein